MVAQDSIIYFQENVANKGYVMDSHLIKYHHRIGRDMFPAPPIEIPTCAPQAFR